MLRQQAFMKVCLQIKLCALNNLMIHIKNTQGSTIKTHKHSAKDVLWGWRWQVAFSTKTVFIANQRGKIALIYDNSVLEG